MRRSYFANSAARWLAVMDLAISAASLGLALAIRANFQAFLVGTTEIALFAPFIVIARPATMYLFEHYSYSPSIWHSRDVLSIFAHNTAPTAILLLLRVISPIPALRLPFSVILMEYAFSVSLMVLARAARAGVIHKPGAHSQYRPRIALYGEIQDIRSSGILDALLESGAAIVVAILTPNPLHWDTDVAGIRVLGDERALHHALQSDDSLSTIVIVGRHLMPAARIDQVRTVAATYNLAVADGAGVILSEHRYRAIPQEPANKETSR